MSVIICMCNVKLLMCHSFSYHVHIINVHDACYIHVPSFSAQQHQSNDVGVMYTVFLPPSLTNPPLYFGWHGKLHPPPTPPLSSSADQPGHIAPC